MRSVIIVFLISILTHNVVAQDDASTLHKRLADQLSAAKTIRVVATSAAMQNARVRISAKRTDKFVVELADRTIICDGKSVWNYTPSRQSVVISKYNARSSSLSVEKLLLEVIAKYKPSSLKSENNSATGSSSILTLNPDGTELYGVKSIVLTVSKKNMQIRKVRMMTDQGKQEWTVQSMQLNIDLPDTIFSFKAPKGVEVVDLRE